MFFEHSVPIKGTSLSGKTRQQKSQGPNIPHPHLLPSETGDEMDVTPGCLKPPRRKSHSWLQRVQASGFRVSGLGFRGLGFRGLGLPGLQALGADPSGWSGEVQDISGLGRSRPLQEQY